MSDREVVILFTTLAKSIKTYEQVTEVRFIYCTEGNPTGNDTYLASKLLAQLPAHWGGLVPLAAGLFHGNPVTRDATLELLDTIQDYPVRRCKIPPNHPSAKLNIGFRRLVEPFSAL